MCWKVPPVSWLFEISLLFHFNVIRWRNLFLNYLLIKHKNLNCISSMDAAVNLWKPRVCTFPVEKPIKKLLFGRSPDFSELFYNFKIWQCQNFIEIKTSILIAESAICYFCKLDHYKWLYALFLWKSWFWNPFLTAIFTSPGLADNQ